MNHNHRRQILCTSMLLAVLQGHSLAVAQVAPDTETSAEPTQAAEPRPEAQTEPQPEAQAAAPVAGAQIFHAPVNESYVDDVRFLFEVTAPDRAGTIVVVVVRDTPRRDPIELKATLMPTGYVAVLPQAEVSVPGFAYYVIERMPDHSERPVFADASTSHHVRVTHTEAEDIEQERLLDHGGHRSTLTLGAEAVDYGDRKLVAGQPISHDRYYKLEVGYGYSFFTTIEDVRISLVRVRGQAALFDEWPTPTTEKVALGIDYGRAAVTIVARESVRLRGAMLLGASQNGFEYGGSASIIIGNPLGSNLDVGTEGLTRLGVVTHVRLGFLASERVPMGAAVEVSTFPVGADAGVRLLYDVGYRFDPVTAVTLRGGYNGRTSVTGGASLGLTFNYGF